MALNLQHQTQAEFAARFWARVRTAAKRKDRYTLHRLVWWVWSRIQAGDLTSNEVRLSYNAAYDKNLTVAEWNSYVTSTLVPMKDRYLAWMSQGDLI